MRVGDGPGLTPGWSAQVLLDIDIRGGDREDSGDSGVFEHSARSGGATEQPVGNMSLAG